MTGVMVAEGLKRHQGKTLGDEICRGRKKEGEIARFHARPAEIETSSESPAKGLQMKILSRIPPSIK